MSAAAGGLDLVLFDLDGTTTDSEPGIAAAYRHTLAALDLPVDEARIRACIGPPLNISLAALGVPPELIGEAVAIWRPWFAVHGIFDNAVYPGISDMLQRLRRAGVPMGLATAKLRRFAVDILDHFELSGYFDPVAGGTSDGRLTHKDEIITDALLEAGIAGSSRVVMVGDREHDMYAATANSAIPLGVSYGYGSRAELEAGGARWVVDSPAEVADLLLALAAARPEARPAKGT